MWVNSLILVLTLLCSSNLGAQEVGSLDEEVKKADMKPWEAWDKYRAQMITISRQLGVTCNYCHNTRNYRDKSNPKWKVAKAHIQMVDLLNSQFKHTFSDKVDCYMCHKGVAKPEFKEKKDRF